MSYKVLVEKSIEYKEFIGLIVGIIGLVISIISLIISFFTLSSVSKQLEIEMGPNISVSDITYGTLNEFDSSVNNISWRDGGNNGIVVGKEKTLFVSTRFINTGKKTGFVKFVEFNVTPSKEGISTFSSVYPGTEKQKIIVPADRESGEIFGTKIDLMTLLVENSSINIYLYFQLYDQDLSSKEKLSIRISCSNTTVKELRRIYCQPLANN